MSLFYFYFLFYYRTHTCSSFPNRTKFRLQFGLKYILQKNEKLFIKIYKNISMSLHRENYKN